MMTARHLPAGILFFFLVVLPAGLLAQQDGDEEVPATPYNGMAGAALSQYWPTGGTLAPEIGVPGSSAPGSFVEWLKEGDSVTIVLTTDLEKLKRDRLRQEYQPMTMTVFNGSEVIKEEGNVRTRGHFRCKHCDTPPMKVKIPKKQMIKAGFGEWNEFKLVLPCRKGKAYEQYVLKEYLIYRLYNVLTDRSFRVKHLNLRVQDINEAESFYSQAAFLIEHTEELEDRIGGDYLDTLSFDPQTFSREDYNRLQVFQFMVGNTDWMPVTAHNLDIIELKEGGLVPVPFDFDFAGMVGTNYATPNPYTGLKKVQTRIFMANRKSKEELEQTFDFFREKEAELLSTIARFEPLDFRVRKQMIRYLQSFFRTIDNPKLVRKQFLNKPPFVYPMY